MSGNLDACTFVPSSGYMTLLAANPKVIKDSSHLMPYLTPLPTPHGFKVSHPRAASPRLFTTACHSLSGLKVVITRFCYRGIDERTSVKCISPEALTQIHFV